MASREMLERQKAYYSERIRVINTQLNLLAPISKLPPEILSNIFLGAVGAESADNDSADGDEECPNEGGRIAISHVCRHWREVALQCAKLWSDLHVPDTPEMVQGFLARSREVPLSITVDFEQIDYFNMDASRRDDTLLGLSALHRVRSLTPLLYKSQRYDPTNAVLERLRGCAPLLESLKIASPSERSNPARLRSAISGILLHPETRPLRSLTTQICYIDWINTPFHALVHLDIRTRGSIKEAGVESFLQALDRMPCLEELTLCEVFSYRIDDCTWDIPEGSQSLITVPRLRRLKIAYKGQPFTGMMLLNRLHAPSLRHLYLDQQGEGLPRDSGLLLAAVSQKAATLGPFSTLSYGPDGTVHAYRKAFQCTADPRDDSTSEWLQQHAAALRVSSGRQFMSELMPLGDVRTLILDGGLPIRDQWLALTRGMEAVTELRSDYDEDELGGMLSLRHGGLGDGHTPYVLPNLDVVTMDTLVFCSLEEPRSIRALANCFAQRALEVAEIKTIRILSAQQICRMDYDNIREAVPYVETDGRL